MLPPLLVITQGPVSRWLVGLCEDHRLLYAFLTVGIMLGAGAALGILTEKVLSAIGMETNKLDNAE
ncbi:MAG: hypothetical protein J7M08_01765 [Planctomycetes bacterium]|nr:hypothetical protein [Planctomycetota bacterium]